MRVIALIGWESNSSFMNCGRELKPIRIVDNKRNLTQEISNLTSNPNPKINRIIIELIIMADFEESISGESRRLTKPIIADRKSKFEDFM